MYINLLSEPLHGATPETRFFLIRYLAHFGLESSVKIKVKEMVSRFGISDRMVTRAVRFLSEKGYLNRTNVHGGGRGRPMHSFSAGDELLAIVEKWSCMTKPIFHLEMIEQLLGVTQVSISTPSKQGVPPGTSDSEGGRDKTLNNAGRLLISVLLANANQIGVVRDIGMTYLTSVTGLNKIQLREYFKKLQKHDYIRKYVKGCAIKGVRGKFKNVFILGLVTEEEGHIDYLFTSECMPLLKQVFMFADDLCRGRQPRDARRLLSSQSDKYRLLINYCLQEISFKDIEMSAHFFNGVGLHNTRGVMRLCMLICELVTALLIDREIGYVKNAKLTKLVARKILQECSRRKLSLACSDEVRHCLMRLLCWMVVQLYWEARSVINTKSSARVMCCDMCLEDLNIRDILMRFKVSQEAV